MPSLLAVRNGILESVRDFMMLVMLKRISRLHRTQGPRMLKRFPALREWVLLKTPLLAGTAYDDKTRMMWVMETRTSFPKCRHCGREFGMLMRVHFSEKYPAYSPHCSCRCSQLNGATRAKLKTTSMRRYGTSSPAGSKAVRDRARATMVGRYGVEHPLLLEEFAEKARATSRERYGTDYPAQNPAIRAKSASTMMRRYGVSNSAGIPGVRERRRAADARRRGARRAKSCFGVSPDEAAAMCMGIPFPGTRRWPGDHPIWDCRVRGRMTPKEAWADPAMLARAAGNMFSMLAREAASRHRDVKFFSRHREAIELARGGDVSRLAERMLNRFTIAKIAPKVTALPERLFMAAADRAEKDGLDLSAGVYCPMAGFGGIVRGASEWLRKRGLDAGRVYAADINPRLCQWYGWERKDVLSDVVETDMTVAACPPFGIAETWDGTPDDMYLPFDRWVELIKRHVKAPRYVFLGPPRGDAFKTAGDGRRLSPMFCHADQASYYPECGFPDR